MLSMKFRQAVEDFSEAAKGRFGNSGEFGD